MRNSKRKSSDNFRNPNLFFKNSPNEKIDLVKIVTYYDKHMEKIYGKNKENWLHPAGYHNCLNLLMDQTKPTDDGYELLDNAIQGVYAEELSNSVIREFILIAEQYGFPKRGKTDYDAFETID